MAEEKGAGPGDHQPEADRQVLRLPKVDYGEHLDRVRHTIAGMVVQRRNLRNGSPPYTTATKLEQVNREMYLDRTEAIRESGRNQEIVVMPRSLRELIVLGVVAVVCLLALLAFINLQLG